MSDMIYREDAINVLEGLSACEEYGVEVGTDEETYIGKYEAITAISDLPSARPKEEQIAIGTVCEVICKHCIKANGCCQHHWKCPLLTEIAELIESKDEPQTERSE